MAGERDNKTALIETAVREGETYLAGQLTLATSADQRAAVLGGVFTAAGTAITAGLIAVHSSGVNSNAIVLGGLAAAVLFLAGAALCISTVMPVGFYLPGNEPESWRADIASNTPLREALDEEANNYQEKIIDNRRVIERNARRFRWGAVSGIAAPVVGFVIWLLVSVPP